MAKEAKIVLDAKAELAEGPCWDDELQQLFWVDIQGKKVHIYGPVKDEDSFFEVGETVGAVVPREKGGAVVVLKNSFCFLDLKNGQLTKVAEVEADFAGNRFNDGKCDPAGRFWAGTMSVSESRETGSLYCLDTDLSVKKMVSGVTTSNGLDWSPDNKTMYYIDSPTKNVFAFDYDLDTGEITNRRVVVTIPEDGGVPDGMTVDNEGMLWVAQWGGHQVARWDPATGEMIERVSLPAARVSSCAFGGKNLDVLYITTARSGLKEDELKNQPQAGGIFKVKTGTDGRAAFRFKG